MCTYLGISSYLSDSDINENNIIDDHESLDFIFGINKWDIKKSVIKLNNEIKHISYYRVYSIYSTNRIGYLFINETTTYECEWLQL
jgi:hypothetical protein